MYCVFFNAVNLKTPRKAVLFLLQISAQHLSGKVVEAENESPVEVSLSGQGVEVDVGLLFVSVQSFDPAAKDNRRACEDH